MKKLVDTIALIADLAPGALCVVAGLAIMLGGITNTLWL